MSKIIEEMARRWGGFLGVLESPTQRRRLLPRGAKTTEFWNDQFSSAVLHLEDWGYDVETGPGFQDRVLLGEHKTIQINSSSHPETRFYTLLHELGHVLIRRRWREFSRRHPNYLDHPDVPVDGRRKRSVCYRIGLVSEEMEAWRRGREWAERQGFFVDPYKYDDEMNRALLGYIAWVAEVSQHQYHAARTAAKTRTRRARRRQKK